MDTAHLVSSLLEERGKEEENAEEGRNTQGRGERRTQSRAETDQNWQHRTAPNRDLATLLVLSSRLVSSSSLKMNSPLRMLGKFLLLTYS